MGLTKTILKLAAPVPRPEAFESYLFIGPHPDDIEIGAGAAAARLAAAGKQVRFLICLDGRFGDGASGGIKGDELAALREKEARHSAKVLGVSDVRFLRLPDGAGYTVEELERGIAQALAEIRPEAVFTVDPDVPSECHPDHLAVGQAVKKVAYLSEHAGIMQKLYGVTGCEPVQLLAFMMTARPNRFVKTGRSLRNKQFQALFVCHTSQYPKDSPEADALKTYLKLRSAEYGLRTFSTGAEAVRALGRLQMHWLPEFG